MLRFDPPRHADHVFGGAVVILLIAGGLLTLRRGSPFPVLFALLGLSVLVPWFLSLRSGRFDVFEPIVFHSVFVGMFCVALFGRVYLYGWAWRQDVITYGYVEGFTLYGTALLVTFWATLLGYYGTLRFGRRSIERVHHAIDMRIRRWSSMPERSRLRTGENQDGRSVSPATVTRSVAVLYMAIGAIAFVVLFLRGPLAQDPFIVFTRGTPRSELFVGHRAFVTLGTLLYLGYFLWLVSVVLDERFPSVLQLGLLPIVVGPFLLLGRRETVISICLIVVVFCYYTRAFRITETTSAVPRLLSRLPRSVYPLVVVGAAASLAVSIPVLRALRLGRSVSDGLADIDAISMLTFGIHNDEIDYFLALREVVPAEIGFYYGTHYLRVFTTPIPRAVWENKPVITAGGLLRRLVMPEASGGRPPGFLGNYYLNFGEFGFLLGGVLFGAILAVVYVLLTRETTGAFGIMLFSIVLPAIGRNGLINNFLAPLLVDLSAVLVALIAVFLISGGHGAPGTSVGSHTLARRNRRAMLAAVGVLAFTVAGSGGTVSLLGRQAREERETIHRRAARRAFELEARGELRDNLDVAELRIEARRGASTVAGTIRNPSDSFTFPASIALRSMDGDDPEYGWIELGDISPQSTVEFARRLDVPVHRPENLAYVVTQWTI